MLKYLQKCNNTSIHHLKCVYISSNYQTILFNSTSSISNYLINSLGFTEHQSNSIGSKLSPIYQVQQTLIPKFTLNANSVVNFFNSLGLDTARVRKIVSFYPRILHSDVNKTLIPKIKHFDDLGFSRSDIAEVILVRPIILCNRFESNTLPRILALREILGNDDDVLLVLKKPHWNILGCVTEYLVKNVDLLRSYGIPLEVIRRNLIKKHALFMKKPEILEDIVVRVEDKFGISRDSGVFLIAVELLCRLSEEIFEAKCRLFKRVGWTDTDILTLFRRNPRCLGLSEARIERVLCFLMKELNYEPAYLASRPRLLDSSLEKRLLPRHRVLTVLNEKGLMTKVHTLFTAVLMTEHAFVKKFVLPFADVHQVYSKHMGCCVKMLNGTEAKCLPFVQ